MYRDVHSHSVLNVTSHLAVLQVCSVLLLFLGHHPCNLRTEKTTAVKQLLTNECATENVCINTNLCLLVVHVLMRLLQRCVLRFVAHTVNPDVLLLWPELLCIPQDSGDNVRWWHHYRRVRDSLYTVHPHADITAATTTVLWEKIMKDKFQTLKRS